MPVGATRQTSFFDPQFVDPGCLEPGTLPWLLARERAGLLPGWLFSGWRVEGVMGRRAWPADVLTILYLLRWSEEGSTRRGACRRALRDSSWRAAMGLAFGSGAPDEKTMREFEAFLQTRHPDTDLPRYLMMHEHWVHLCRSGGVIQGRTLAVVDSTPMYCYGAVLDTVRLLGDGLRSLVKQWAKATRTSSDDVAATWGIEALVAARSTKGAFEGLDWRYREDRTQAITRLATWVVDCVTDIRRQLQSARRSFRKRLLRQCRTLLIVVGQDLEATDDGRLVIAQRVAKDRTISMTEPQARHGRKSKSKAFNGFKLHVLGEAISGLILSVAVTPGNRHDGSVAHRLVRRAQHCLADLSTVMGDSAYGGAGTRATVRGLTGVAVQAPPPAAALFRPDDGLVKADFQLDMENGTARCLAGVTTTELKSVKKSDKQATQALWSADACQGCELAAVCPTLRKGGPHGVTFHPHETELREALTAWEDPAFRRAYLQRSQGERLIHRMTRRGGRQARSFGIRKTVLQAHAIAGASNLALLAKARAEALRAEESLSQKAA
jgi:hypothetical protein